MAGDRRNPVHGSPEFAQARGLPGYVRFLSALGIPCGSLVPSIKGIPLPGAAIPDGGTPAVKGIPVRRAGQGEGLVIKGIPVRLGTRGGYSPCPWFPIRGIPVRFASKK